MQQIITVIIESYRDSAAAAAADFNSEIDLNSDYDDQDLFQNYNSEFSAEVMQNRFESEVKKKEKSEEITLYALKEEEDVKIEVMDENEVKMEVISSRLNENTELYLERFKIIKYIRDVEVAEANRFNSWHAKLTIKHLYLAFKNNPDILSNSYIYYSQINKLSLLLK